MTHQHTPGPWESEPTGTRKVGQSVPWAIWRGGIRLAIVDARPLHAAQESEANARLIVQAPAMYEIVRLLSERDERDPLVEDAIELLAKVEPIDHDWHANWFGGERE